MTRSTIDDETPAPEGRKPAAEDLKPRREERTAEVPPPRKWIFVVVFFLLVLLVGYGAYEHVATSNQADEAQKEQVDFVPEVTTITAKADAAPVNLTLPGQTEPFDTATIYARATGYVAERLVDIGSRVKKGDLLIRIAAPDLDQQLAQAKGQLAQTIAAQGQAQAQLAQAKANLSLAQITSKRFNTLTEQGYQTVQNNDNQATQVQSQQANVETAQASIKVADANTQAQQATVGRLEALVSFERVIAPFDGVVTTRGVDIGDLVNADTKTGTPLFTIASDKVLRVTVHVPQANAFGVKDGLEGVAFLPQKPDEKFSGKIARSSVALLNSARTLDTEVDIQNPTGALRPGAYVDVSFAIPRIHPNIVVPAETLIFNQSGPHVAVVQDDEVHMVPISIYRDYGSTLELSNGLNEGDQIVINAPVDLKDHSKVKVKAKPPENEAAK